MDECTNIALHCMFSDQPKTVNMGKILAAKTWRTQIKYVESISAIYLWFWGPLDRFWSASIRRNQLILITVNLTRIFTDFCRSKLRIWWIHINDDTDELHVLLYEVLVSLSVLLTLICLTQLAIQFSIIGPFGGRFLSGGPIPDSRREKDVGILGS